MLLLINVYFLWPVLADICYMLYVKCYCYCNDFVFNYKYFCRDNNTENVIYIPQNTSKHIIILWQVKFKC